MSTSKKKWSQEEIIFLQDNWGVKSIPSIANSLGRTIIAIRGKAVKLGLKRFIHAGEYITVNQLIHTLGYSSGGCLIPRLLKLGLPYKYKFSVNKKMRIIYLEDFWKWAEMNKQALNFANFEEGLLGAEPEWVKGKRKSDLINPSKVSHNRKWTKAQDNTLISMCRACRYTYKDIARELNRTEGAVKRHLSDLGVPYRPIPLDNHIKWTKEENERMLELHRLGHDTNSIAKELNKSQLSISDRIRAMQC